MLKQQLQNVLTSQYRSNRCTSFAFTPCIADEIHGASLRFDLEPIDPTLQLQKNLNLVLMADKALFIDHNLTTLDKYFSSTFIDHSPLIQDPITGLKQLVIEAGNALRHGVKRAWADKDLVALHGSYSGLADHLCVGFDIYRVKQGKIVEHWHALVAEHPANASGRTQLDGDIRIIDLDKTEKNRQLVTIFFNDVLKKQNYQHIPDYTNGIAFKQHGTDLADGTEAMQHFLEEHKQQATPLIYNKLHRTIAQGQFVMTHAEGEFKGQPSCFCELWRVENNKIVELWSAITPLSKTHQAIHPNAIG